ncbi:DNA mismatch repair protein MutS [Clostridium fungisolvens]|uniref:DNA mismatch repair protein MutS n=1 Tax=Clostridium fungisolvens TaxID=1604897 RepID=A0A6V8SGH4_9CLOT|nr:DNA mismatch repair protein MutS [Clostridium fungisolvens]GFP75891.1 DNA mismatch repair protein MutS [Clostridium fungisolvens]
MGLTPMMQQYMEIKENYKDCILFFRLGDFYEMFFEDAEVAAKELELVLTGRDCGLESRAPMCGIPYHASNSYIGRLIAKGFKVAICEQVEDPALAKGLVKRDVIKIITPGTYSDSNYIDESKNNYIMCIFVDTSKNTVGLSTTDISTGDFLTTSFQYNENIILDEISKFSPKEIILNILENTSLISSITDSCNALITRKPLNYFEEDTNDLLSSQFGDEKKKLDSFSLYSSIGLIKYVIDTQKMALSNLNRIDTYSIVDFMTIDTNSRRNLELTENIREKTKKGSLLWVLDKTSTAMGSREIRRWIDQPLIVKSLIEDRLSGVEELHNNLYLMEQLKETLKDIYDIERITGKIANFNVNAKDMISLKVSLQKIPNLKLLLKDCNSSMLSSFYNRIDELEDVSELLDISIADEPSLSVKEGNIIKSGYSIEVDELRQAKIHGREWIAALENQERDFTGIRSLKVGYNKVFGYYIEISKANYSSIPEGRYIRKQTLANAERFVTQELKEMEEKILGAEEKLTSLEYSIFVEIRDKIEAEIDRMKHTAKIIAELDCLCSLANVAINNNYVKPLINEEDVIDIKEGRHPVVEQVISKGEFISNNTKLDVNDEQLLIITGPNMAGKSTYMRQVALITLMAQIGSFVPASYANISVCDKIFTRIGASDDLAGGKSTFMVEMWEVANILNNATRKSLVLLDEVGRGTSTYDGLSIAWSVIEYMTKDDSLKCKTLFATHYHELTRLEKDIKGVKNFSVAVKEVNNTIIFLRKIVEGGADQSYGIEVAKLAGLPNRVIDRAKEILSSLEDNKIHDKLDGVAASNNDTSKGDASEVAVDIIKESANAHIKTGKGKKQKEDSFEPQMQLNFTDIEKETLLKSIASMDIMSMTPLETMNKLYDLVKRAKELL